jgi:hypothetical protein
VFDYWGIEGKSWDRDVATLSMVVAPTRESSTCQVIEVRMSLDPGCVGTSVGAVLTGLGLPIRVGTGAGDCAGEASGSVESAPALGVGVEVMAAAVVRDVGSARSEDRGAGRSSAGGRPAGSNADGERRRPRATLPIRTAFSNETSWRPTATCASFVDE